MNTRFFVLIFLVVLSLGYLIYAAVNNTAKAVVTVEQLLQKNEPAKNIRLGARVSDDQIDYQTTPEFLLRFHVHDIVSQGGHIPVLYHNMKPDTLKAGRDVILEGDYDGTEFVAKQLVTQCPSKYEVPTPSGKPAQPAT